MRRFAIIGSGYTGLLAAHALRRGGHEVTLFSDRSPEQWLQTSRPTGTAMRFHPALEYERELGLAHWEHEAIATTGVEVTIFPEPHNQLLTMTGRLEHPAFAVDLRLQSHRWMRDFQAAGGHVVEEKVTVARLDAITADHDLTFVATGNSDLTALFPKDDARSGPALPVRRLIMVIGKTNGANFLASPFTHVKFHIVESCGEIVWVPFHHKDHGSTIAISIEAKPGGAFDRFGDVHDGEDAMARVQAFTREFVPSLWPATRELVLADPYAWLTGGIAQTVRHPVGRLPSGRVVAALGDTAMSMDPIGAQGANTGNKMVRHFAQAIAERGDQPFDETWLLATHQSFYADQGERAFTFNGLLLGPMSAGGQELLIAQYGSTGRGDSAAQKMANAVTANFTDPRRLTHCYEDVAAARAFISRTTGRSWWRAALRHRLAIAWQQIRQRFGLPPRHPRMS